MTYQNLEKSVNFRILKDKAKPGVGEGITPDSIEKFSVPAGGGMTFNYAARGIDNTLIDSLQKIADDQELILKYRALLGGEVMNIGEKRMVLHHLTRGQHGDKVLHNGRDIREFYLDIRKHFSDFAVEVQEGKITGSTGRPFDTVVQVGIGGSDLGPRALCIAMGNIYKPKLKTHFISNVDPDDANSVLAALDPETTLFILVSKSGTTQETLTNIAFAHNWMDQKNIPGLIPEKHTVVVTSETSPLAQNKDYLAAFYIDDYIGGRYSSTSAVGGVILSLAYSPDLFNEIIEGAREADGLALSSDITKNAAMMDAMIGVYERNILNYPCAAVLPYSEALSRFPAHIQQLDMESNGKSVGRDGKEVPYQTGPIIFGEPGTNGQHSFYQLLHQGTQIVPLQFIGFQNPQIPFDRVVGGSTSQQKLNANLVAQIIAFACGEENADPNKQFAGGRPSSLLHGRQLTPRSLGAILAHYENKVMFQGFAWNINSFDQEGVQLGKVLTKKLLSGDGSSELKAFASLLGL